MSVHTNNSLGKFILHCIWQLKDEFCAGAEEEKRRKEYEQQVGHILEYFGSNYIYFEHFYESLISISTGMVCTGLDWAGLNNLRLNA